MSPKISYILLLFSCFSFSQSITVDDTGYSASDLVNLLLSDSCIDATNISYSSAQSVAYFNNNSSAFPITEGIILRTGEAKLTEGVYTDTNLSSLDNTSSDPTLETISEETGQSATITDIAFLQFEFTPISSDFNFDFIFASNEYGEWQCGFSDVFAFLLTDLSTSTTTNLAVIPATTTPVTVTTIRDNAYNSSCTSTNPGLFSTYNVTSPATSTLNMRGHTTVLNASSTLIPGNTYRIRLVIGDYNNPDFDSAVFIDSGSFITTLDLGPDAFLCEGDTTSVTTNLSEADYTHSWTLDSVIIPGETDNTLEITEAGTYEVTAVKSDTGCTITDTIIISDLPIISPNDLFECDNGTGSFTYNLSLNNETSLGLDDAIYNVFYYEELADIATDTPITAPDITNFNSPGNETIYIKIFNTSTGNFCDTVLEFDLLISEATVATTPDDILLCDEGAEITVDLTQQNIQILNGLSPLDFGISFFSTLSDAENNINSIGTSINVSMGASPITIWAQLQNISNPDCFDIISFNIIVNPLPTVSTLENAIECSEYTLPTITDGDYFTETDGGGTMLNAGDVIDESGTYFIFIGPDANGCTNQSSFTLTLIDEYTIPEEYCGEFTVPTPPLGNFYDAPDGPSGTGSVIPPGTVFTADVIIHYYAEIDGVECRNEPINISVYALPVVDTPADVVTCINYTLPSINDVDGDGLPDGIHYIDEIGTIFNPGDVITTSGTYTVYNEETHNPGAPNEITCQNYGPFEIDIINNPGNRTECGSYTLPTLAVGDYYTSPNGVGLIDPADYVYDTPGNFTIYIYAVTSTAPNCTDDMAFDLEIIPIPPVDELEDVLSCIDAPYVLPVIANGEYFTLPGRTGTEMFAGDEITTEGVITLYINNLVDGCENESEFIVETRSLPLVESFTDVFTCEPYELQPIVDGTYYTGPNASGTTLESGTLISETQTIYIHNAWDDLASCYSETVFEVNVLGVDVGEFEDINECDSYMLPPLTVGDYYVESQLDPASGSVQLNAGDIISNSQTIYIYAENGDRFLCRDESELTITISETPVLPVFSNQVVCGSYELPLLDNTIFNQNYYSEPGGNSANLIDTSTPLTTLGEQTIYVYASAFDNINCFDETSFTVTIHPLLELIINDGIICVDPETHETIQPALLESNLDPAEFTVNWYLGGTLIFTGADLLADTIGTYTVETIMLAAEAPPICNYATTTVTVTESSAAIATYDITEDFENNAIITVITEGYGDYQYQLDDGPFQDSNQFHNVPSGDHVITVRDIMADCGIFLLEVTVIKYPKFFTPNGDGDNDSWNIWDLSNQPEALVTIYDRFGKLITQISPSGNGWDGTYNGNNQFATDYWFVVKYKGRNDEDKEFRAHFSLKR